jgi:hypothetical protein
MQYVVLTCTECVILQAHRLYVMFYEWVPYLICHAKLADTHSVTFRSKSKNWLVWKQHINESGWNDMSARGLLFQWANTTNRQLWFGLVYGKNQSPRFTDKNDCSHSTSEKCHGHADTFSQNKYNIYGYTDSKGLKITYKIFNMFYQNWMKW